MLVSAADSFILFDDASKLSSVLSLTCLEAFFVLVSAVDSFILFDDASKLSSVLSLTYRVALFVLVWATDSFELLDATSLETEDSKSKPVDSNISILSFVSLMFLSFLPRQYFGYDIRILDDHRYREALFRH